MIEVVQAFDRALIAQLDSEDAAALDRKIETARRLFADRRAWLKPHQRIEILRKLAVLMESKRQHLGRQIAREGGKPLSDALVETGRAIDGVRDAAEELRVMAGREIPMGLTPASIDRRAFTIWEPIGVVAAISAFNHPLKSRVDDRDTSVSKQSVLAELAALREWGVIPPKDRFAMLGKIHHPTLVVQGNKDVVVMPINAFLLAEHLPNAQLIMYPDASHGAQSQHADIFLKHVKLFLH
jgi:pimeloyl-ACP methyl ester carboxylesterase